MKGIDINNLIPKPSPSPSYDKAVLEPLHKAQEAKKVADAKAAADALAAQQAAQAAALAEQQRQESLVAGEVQAPLVQTVAVSGNCATWLAQAGITDVADAMYILNRESGCNPLAVNASSGACGVGQALPCGKMGCAWGDGACQMVWMNSYVIGRYGSWAGAVAFWQSHNWY